MRNVIGVLITVLVKCEVVVIHYYIIYSSLGVYLAYLCQGQNESRGEPIHAWEKSSGYGANGSYFGADDSERIMEDFAWQTPWTSLKAWQVAVVAVICALFIGLTWNFAIARSRNEISAWLGNQQLMLDTSVVLTLEVIWQMAYCMLSGKLIYDGKVSRRTLYSCTTAYW